MGSSVLHEGPDAAPEDVPLLGSVRALGFPEVGRSSEGRPIFGGVFGAGAPSLLVVGGVHGDEPSSVEAAVALARRLAAGAAAAPLVLGPALNPDRPPP